MNPYYGAGVPDDGLKLQQTLSAATSGMGDPVTPHHPIACLDRLSLDDRALSCPHASAGAGSVRTVAAIQHSIALLLLELAQETYL